MLFVTTDPVSEAYWARDIINAERVAQGMSVFDCPWVEEASGDPYNLGISDPAQMDVIYANPASVADGQSLGGGRAFLAPGVPNPFRQEARLRFRMLAAGEAELLVVTPSGRAVRHLARGHYPRGYREARWDGRDDSGRALPAGVYIACLRTGSHQSLQRLVLAR
jgi:hypothetical protein